MLKEIWGSLSRVTLFQDIAVRDVLKRLIESSELSREVTVLGWGAALRKSRKCNKGKWSEIRDVRMTVLNFVWDYVRYNMIN